MKNEAIKITVLGLLFLSMITFSACSSKDIEDSSKPYIEETQLFMGTVCSVRIYDKQDPKYIKEAFKEIKDIENKMSINILDSELSEVNKNAGKAPVKVSDKTFYVVEKGIDYSKLSKGNFDITIGPLVQLWDIGGDNPRVPMEDEINSAISKIDYNNIEMNKITNEIFLKKEGMVIDLGAIAKGYTADSIKDILLSNGVEKAIINMGGNVVVVGKNDKEEPWKIGIQDPTSPRGAYIGIIDAEDKSIVTSGIYERFLEANGVKYHHILNPFTGYPWESEIAGVTIVSEYSVDGDALSTTTFSLGVEKGLEFIERLDNVEAIFVTTDKNVYITSGLKGNFRISNQEFKLVN